MALQLRRRGNKEDTLSATSTDSHPRFGTAVNCVLLGAAINSRPSPTFFTHSDTESSRASPTGMTCYPCATHVPRGKRKAKHLCGRSPTGFWMGLGWFGSVFLLPGALWEASLFQYTPMSFLLEDVPMCFLYLVLLSSNLPVPDDRCRC